MQTIQLKGSKEELLEAIYQFLANHLSAALPDLAILQYIFEEILDFVYSNNLRINVIDISLEANLIKTRIDLEIAYIRNHTFKSKEIESFLAQAGILLLLPKCEFIENGGLAFSYNLSHIDCNFIDKRQQFIHDYWKKSINLKAHG